MNVEKSTVTGHLLAFVTIIVWGTTFISTKLLLTEFTPLEILLFRFIVGYAVLFLLYPRRIRTALLRKRDYLLRQRSAVSPSIFSSKMLPCSIRPHLTPVLLCPLPRF